MHNRTIADCAVQYSVFFVTCKDMACNIPAVLCCGYVIDTIMSMYLYGMCILSCSIKDIIDRFITDCMHRARVASSSLIK